MTPVKADLGTKRVCPSCNARFYDLQKRPIECPKCQFSFDPEALYKQRRVRQPEQEKPTVERARNEDEEEELEDAEKMEGAEPDEAEAEDATIVEADDEDDALVVAEEEEAETAGMSVVDPTAEDAELEDVEEEEIVEEDAGDAALLDDVGEEDDVSGIIDTGLEKDER
jgi:uncharacterized protein (TIGR02300 family)